jgi:Fe-S-cluster containining protein
MERCTGHCCRRFCLPAPYKDFEEEFAFKMLGGNPSKWAEVEKVFPMLIPLGVEDGAERFTCKHLLPNGDCGDYENRPRMCRDYPYEDSCMFSGCTYKPRCEQG